MSAPILTHEPPDVPREASGGAINRSKSRQRIPFWRNPWRKPYFLATGTWLYIAWSLIPVLIAIQFSFNDGRSRSTWQGFSTQWYCCADGSLWTDKSLITSLENSLILAFLTVLVATPLGVLLALGLTRWRSKAAKASNGLALVPLVTPEIVLGAALYLVILNLYQGLPFGRTALLLGHVTFTLSFVLVIVRSRLLAIGPDYEMAARDLGATPMQAIRTVLVPLLMPAVVASAAITFATSLDDFVVSSFLFGDASNITVPVRLYSAVKAAPTPGLNALATVLLVGSFLALIVAYLGLRLRRRGGQSALEELTTFET
ncbi:MAG TPA: ABC transporter permease [Actinomycetes bacterium]|nr:ABC transporter permease [Actinomycetes bacterium]